MLRRKTFTLYYPEKRSCFLFNYLRNTNSHQFLEERGEEKGEEEEVEEGKEEEE